MLEVVEVHRAAVAAGAALLLAVELGHHLVHVRALGDRVPVRAVRRGDHVVRLERRADAGGDRLLADAHVQEAGQLARPEALLHLLLEAADEQHLAEQLAEPLLRERVLRAWLLLDLRHCGLHYADARMGLVEQWRRIRSRTCPRTGRRPASHSPFRTPRSAQRAAALLGPASPGSHRRRAACDGQSDRRRDRPGPAARSCSGSSTRRGSAARCGCSRPVERGAASATRRARSSQTRGRRPSPRCRPTGATCTASSSSTRATTSTAPRCWSRRSTRPASPAAAPSASALRTASATAPRRR